MKVERQTVTVSLEQTMPVFLDVFLIAPDHLLAFKEIKQQDVRCRFCFCFLKVCIRINPQQLETNSLTPKYYFSPRKAGKDLNDKCWSFPPQFLKSLYSLLTLIKIVSFMANPTVKSRTRRYTW